MNSTEPMMDAPLPAAEPRYALRRHVLALQGEVENLSGRLADSYEELSLIYQVSGGMRVNRRPADFFRQACTDAAEVLDVQGVGVTFRPDASPEPPRLYGPHALPPELLGRLSGQLLDLFAAGRTLPLLVNRVSGDSLFGWLAPHLSRLMAVPMQRGEAVLGCLFALDKNPRPAGPTPADACNFDSQDSKLLGSLANEAAVYLENASLYDDARDLTMGLVHSLVSAVDAKDPYTCGHSERVALLGRALAREAGLPEAQAERVYLAGLLHDVGKIGVADTVLRKAGKLTAEEFEEVKRTPASAPASSATCGSCRTSCPACCTTTSATTAAATRTDWPASTSR